MTKEQYEAIAQWQKETFGKATPFSKLAHLQQEVKELIVALDNNGKATLGTPAENSKMQEEVCMEYADCFFLLFGSAAAWGLNFTDITELIDRKFKINKERKWGKPDENGVVNHIKS